MEKLYIESTNIKNIAAKLQLTTEPVKIKHFDTTIVFVKPIQTSKIIHLYAEDIDEEGVDLFKSGEFSKVITDHYGDNCSEVIKLLNELKKQGLEVKLRDYGNTLECGVEDLERDSKISALLAKNGDGFVNDLYEMCLDSCMEFGAMPMDYEDDDGVVYSLGEFSVLFSEEQHSEFSAEIEKSLEAE